MIDSNTENVFESMCFYRNNHLEGLDAFQSLTHKEARAEYNRLQKAEKLYLKAVEGAGWKYVKGEIEKAIGDAGVDKDAEVRYNRKAKFLHRNFPSESESGSEAHRLAIWWASHRDVETGDQTLISLNNSWYVVEKFDNQDNGYQVERFVAKAEYNSIFEEIKQYGRSGQIKSIQRGFDEYDCIDQQIRGSVRTQESGSDRNISRHGRENPEMDGVAQTEIEERERSASDRSRDRESGGSNRKGNTVKYSLKDPISDEIERERNFNYSEGQEAKADANVNRKKVYTKQDAQQIVSAVLAGYMNFGEAYGNLLGKSCAEFLWYFLAKRLY